MAGTLRTPPILAVRIFMKPRNPASQTRHSTLTATEPPAPRRYQRVMINVIVGVTLASLVYQAYKGTETLTDGVLIMSDSWHLSVQNRFTAMKLAAGMIIIGLKLLFSVERVKRASLAVVRSAFSSGGAGGAAHVNEAEVKALAAAMQGRYTRSFQRNQKSNQSIKLFGSIHCEDLSSENREALQAMLEVRGGGLTEQEESLIFFGFVRPEHWVGEPGLHLTCARSGGWNLGSSSGRLGSFIPSSCPRRSPSTQTAPLTTHPTNRSKPAPATAATSTWPCPPLRAASSCASSSSRHSRGSPRGPGRTTRPPSRTCMTLWGPYRPS